MSTLDERICIALERIADALEKKAKPKAKEPKAKDISAEDEAPQEAWGMAHTHRRMLLLLDPQHTVGGKKYSAKRHAKSWHVFQSAGAANPIEWVLIERVMRYHLNPRGNPYWHTRLSTVSRVLNSWSTLVAQMDRGGHRQSAVERTSAVAVSDADRLAARQRTIGD